MGRVPGSKNSAKKKKVYKKAHATWCRSSDIDQVQDDLKKESFHSQTCLGNEDNNICQICLSSFKIGEEIASSRNPICLHEFHSQCIIEWLSRPNQTSCPVCRAEYANIGTDETHESVFETL